jgi:predicted RNase H-like HicB family nuclease
MKYPIKYPVIIHKSQYGYNVDCPILPGCVSQGDTYEEALDNIKDAITEYLLAVEQIINRRRKQKSNQISLVEVKI